VGQKYLWILLIALVPGWEQGSPKKGGEARTGLLFSLGEKMSLLGKLAENKSGG